MCSQQVGPNRFMDQIYPRQLAAIRPRIMERAETGANVHFSICNTLNEIREGIIKNAPPEIAQLVEKLTIPIRSSLGEPPYPGDSGHALAVCDQLLAIIGSPVNSQSGGTAAITRLTPESRTVFIVHGHDQVNLLRLERLLKDRFGFTPVILMEQASGGQTIIEKFERVAVEATFCLALMTPDDQIMTGQDNATQARPNVIFEIGWFYGRLGRARVCILSKRGTSIHSDLSGIVRIEFIENIEEVVTSLEKELKRAGLVT